MGSGIFVCILSPISTGNEKPLVEDDCQPLEQKIQGRKHGFLAGNMSSYVGGYHASWKPVEDETLGLTHPFHHDLRSRGVGLLESKIPVAPEAYERDLTLFGDQYSNFNAGKILLYLEGLAGLEYSIPGQKLTLTPAVPKSWDWMEVRLPIANHWTRIRYDKNEVKVDACPFPVVLSPR